MIVCGSQSILTAQARPARTPVIGLRNWTREQVNDSLVKHFGPGGGLDSHACGANLLKLGFARTAVIGFREKNGPTKIVVALVEPQDSARVRTNVLPRASVAIPTAWDIAVEAFVDSATGYFQRTELRGMVGAFPVYARGQRDSALTLLRNYKIKPRHEVVWPFLATHTTSADRDMALTILAGDSSASRRTLAVAVLSNFGESDDTWRILVHALRDPDGSVAFLANDVLKRWARKHPHAVDWSASVDDIRVLLAGANLWILPELMGTLVRTQISPMLAGPILRDNGTYVLGYLGVQELPAASTVARQLLMQLSGKDYGSDVTAWKAWVDSFGAEQATTASAPPAP